MASRPSDPPRGERTKKEIEKQLFDLCQEIADDGVVSLDEIKSLRRWLRAHGSVDLPSAISLSETVERIVADGVVTSAERSELLSAINRILVVMDTEKSIEATCEKCNRKYWAAESLVGKMLRCPSCDGLVIVPLPEAIPAGNADHEEFWGELDRNHGSPNSGTSEPTRPSKKTDTEILRSYTQPVRRASGAGTSAKRDSAFRDYLPMTLGIGAIAAGLYVGAFAFSAGRKDLLTLVVLASVVALVGAVVWWRSRYQATIVHVQRKSKQWVTETTTTTDDEGFSYQKDVVVYQYFLYTDHGFTTVSESLFDKLEEGGVYRLMTQMVAGELDILNSRVKRL